MKAIRSCAHALRLSYVNACCFSRELKRKLAQQQKQRKSSQKPIIKEGKKKIEKIQKTKIMMPDPSLVNIVQTSLAQKKGLENFIQVGPALIVFLDCLHQLEANIFSNRFFYDLFFMEKFTSLLVLSNLIYPSKPVYKYMIIGTVIGLNFIPVLNMYGIGSQIIQIAFVLLNDSQKIPQDAKLTQKQNKMLKQRMKMKLYLYSILIAIIFLKSSYKLNRDAMEQKIKIIDDMNTKQNKTNLLMNTDMTHSNSIQ